MGSSATKARITVDARMLDAAGIGTYLAELLPRVIRRMPDAPFTVLGDEVALGRLLRSRPNVELRTWRTRIHTIREQLDSVLVIPRDTALYWAPHFNVPLAWRGPLAVTVHDVAALVMPGVSFMRRVYARLFFPEIRRRASVVIFDSEFSRTEFHALVGSPRRSVTAPLGVDERWFGMASTHERGDVPYLLFVGNVKPHKNLSRLLDAFERVSGRIPHRLVLIGRLDGMRTVDRNIETRTARLGDRVALTGYIEPTEVERYIAGCDVLLLPSLYEGFGLPPLEALACGRAVAVSRAASLPEVCGPEAEYFDPLDVASIASTLERVATRPPDLQGDIERRQAWARRFSWDACAEVTVAELRRALPPSTRSR